MVTDRIDVVVADDEPAVCDVICDALSQRGFRCRTVGDGRSALGAAGPDCRVLVCDVRMPGFSGLDVLRRTRRLCPDKRVILMSGRTGTKELADALRMGAFDFLIKPFHIDSLVDTVAKALNGRVRTGPLAAKAASAMCHEPLLMQAALEGIRALVRAVEAKDPYTRRHSEQVAYYTVNLAAAHGMRGDELDSLRVAAVLHDIGKIGVPDGILTKPGPLTAREFEYIRKHPALGGAILGSITCFAREARLVCHHHERWDGRGYPDGVAGRDIPLGARIINIADCIDAMLMRRTYKAPYPVGRMLRELEAGAGTQFDPDLVRMAVGWCRRHSDRLILSPCHSLRSGAA